MRIFIILIFSGFFLSFSQAKGDLGFETIPRTQDLVKSDVIDSISQTTESHSESVWQVIPRISKPVKTGLINIRHIHNEVRETLKLRIKIKKFVVTKTPQGPNIKFSPVCEIPGSTDVKDLSGGGLISEEVLGACDSLFKDKKVTVVLSGMVYDNSVADFSDESEVTTRNFFAHLSLSSSDFIFGLGDFNLDNTRDLESEHFASHLSVDPKFGGSSNVREGFTVTVRYVR